MIYQNGLEKKQPSLEIVELSKGAEAFASEIQTIAIQGIPAVKEHVFYHQASKTLMVTDIFFYNPDVTWLTKAYFWLNNVYYYYYYY